MHDHYRDDAMQDLANAINDRLRQDRDAIRDALSDPEADAETVLDGETYLLADFSRTIGCAWDEVPDMTVDELESWARLDVGGLWATMTQGVGLDRRGALVVFSIEHAGRRDGPDPTAAVVFPPRP